MDCRVFFVLLTCSVSALDIKFSVNGGFANPIDDRNQGYGDIALDGPTARSAIIKSGGKSVAWRELAGKNAAKVQSLRNQSILFFGDSIVEAFSEENQNIPLKKPFPKLWKKYFVDRYGPSHASGIGGDRISNLLWRLQNGETPKHAQPRVIMLHIGTNDLSYGWYQTDKKGKVPAKDMAAQFFEGYRKVVEELDKQSPYSTILLTAIFPRHAEWPNGGYGKIVPEMNNLIQSLADQSTIYFADCSSALLKDGKISQDYSQDFLHPTAEGAQRWAECLQPTLDKLLLK